MEILCDFSQNILSTVVLTTIFDLLDSSAAQEDLIVNLKATCLSGSSKLTTFFSNNERFPVVHS